MSSTTNYVELYQKGFVRVSSDANEGKVVTIQPQGGMCWVKVYSQGTTSEGTAAVRLLDYQPLTIAGGELIDVMGQAGCVVIEVLPSA
ncbi:hypothetical protein [Erwinia phage Snitter]|nr:hypothetical protein [Erwinia phage Snitter]